MVDDSTRREDWVTIKTLKAKNPKMSDREIARLIDVSESQMPRLLVSKDYHVVLFLPLFHYNDD